MERIEATLQEVLQRLETIAPPQVEREEQPKFVQQWGQSSIRGAGHQRLGQIYQERRFEAQEHRRPNQDYQELPPRFQDCFQNPQDLSSTEDEHQERLMDDQERRFQPHYDDKRREPAEYKMKIDLPSYDGKRNVETFLDWLKNTEKNFRKKVHLVALQLKVGASARWEQEVNRRRNQECYCILGENEEVDER